MIKFIYSEKAIKFCEISTAPQICSMQCQSNLQWRLRKILLPSQNMQVCIRFLMLLPLFSAPFVVPAIVAAPIIFVQIKCRVAEAGEQGADFTDHWYYRNLCKYSQLSIIRTDLINVSKHILQVLWYTYFFFF